MNRLKDIDSCTDVQITDTNLGLKNSVDRNTPNITICQCTDVTLKHSSIGRTLLLTPVEAMSEEGALGTKLFELDGFGT